MYELNAGNLLLRDFLNASNLCRYLLNGIKEFPTAEEFVQELASMGFIEIGFQRLTLGIVAIHTARKPQPKGFD